MSSPSLNLTRLASLIQELGYRAKIEQDSNSISTAMSGFKVLIFAYAHPSIQVYIGFNRDAAETFGVEQANTFNMNNRFAKCYILENVLRFEGDFLFDADQPDADKRIDEIFRTWEILIGRMLSAIDDSNDTAIKMAKPVSGQEPV